MKYLVSIVTVCFLFGCKPSERSAESPKARFEPRSTTNATTKPAQTTPARVIVTAEERGKQVAALETELGALEGEVRALQTKTAATTTTPVNTEEINALAAKIATVRNELVSAQQLDLAAWPARREQLAQELSAYRSELELLTKKIG